MAPDGALTISSSIETDSAKRNLYRTLLADCCAGMRDYTPEVEGTNVTLENAPSEVIVLANLAFGRTVVPVPNRNREHAVNKLGLSVFCRLQS